MFTNRYLLLVAFITVKLFVLFRTVSQSFMLRQFRRFRETTRTQTAFIGTRIKWFMIFDVVFQRKFIGESFSAWMATICVRIQMTMDMLQYASAATKFLTTTSQVAGFVVHDAIMIFGFDECFELIAANFTFHAKEFTYLRVFFGCVFFASTTQLYVRILPRFILFFAATFVINTRW